jgi:hypothetical protein
MTDPAPITATIPASVEAFASRLAARYPNARPVAEYAETPAEAAQRAATLAATRTRLWRPPPEFETASLASLGADQDPGCRVTRWLDSGARNLVLHSTTTGNGKSYAAHAVGNTALSRGMWVATWSVSRLNEALRPGRDDTAFEVATTVDVLILDDLGGESMSTWTVERLLDVLNGRATKRTVVTTNLTGQRLTDRYGDRITDRVAADAWIVAFEGPSRRRPAPW